MVRSTILLATGSILVFAGCAEKHRPECAGSASGFLISNVSIIDGSGAPPFTAAVRVADGLISAVGESAPCTGETNIDGGGLVLAPGFIDTHSHADRDLFGHPDALPVVSQGITTVVVGQDGSAPFPLAEFFARLRAEPPTVNVASYAGHNTLRELVMGDDFRRAATDTEVAEMAALLEEELAAGALGFATGLEYEPGIHSDTAEVLALARVAADAGTRYISHVRSEDRWFEDAIDEMILIGRETGMPVQVSHLKLAMKRLLGTADALIARLDAARAEGIDITADIYPYEYWQSTMMVLLPERDYTDRDAIVEALDQIAPPDGLWMTKFDPNPDYVGKTLTEIAELREVDAVTADTIFQSGSVGKQFTAMAVLQLAEAGKLTLDDPLAMHFPAGPAAWHRITVRQLLAHTSGMRDYVPEVDYRRDYDEAELLAVAARLPVEFDPGSQWSYSNSGYMVLGVLISKLAGEHWSEFAARNIFVPAGMKTTRVITEAGIVAHRAAGYERDEGGELRNQDWVAPPFNTQADGALYFSVRDFAAWDAALRKGKLMDEASYTAWWSPIVLTAGYPHPYGFGWDLSDQRGRRVVEHGGSWQGFRAYFGRYVEDDISVAVLANVGDADAELIGHEIAGRLRASLELPAPGAARDSHRDLLATLRGVLESWSRWAVSPAMGEALAATRTGSPREANERVEVGERLAGTKRFAFLAEDELAERDLERRGGRVQRIVYAILESQETVYRYRFYLSADDRVLDFGEI